MAEKYIKTVVIYFNGNNTVDVRIECPIRCNKMMIKSILYKSDNTENDVALIKCNLIGLNEYLCSIVDSCFYCPMTEYKINGPINSLFQFSSYDQTENLVALNGSLALTLEFFNV